MILEILNKRTPRYRTLKSEGLTIIDVDRSSPLGNPFHMKTEKDRNLVCSLYAEFFANIVLEESTKPNPNEFYRKLIEIVTVASVRDVYLACWCAPRKCHASTIKQFVNETIQSLQEGGILPNGYPRY